MKLEIAESSKDLSKEIARSERKMRRVLEKNITTLKQKLAIFPKSQRLKQELSENLEQLKGFDEAEIKKRMHMTHFYNVAQDRHSMLSAKQAQKKSAFNRLMISLKDKTGKKSTKQEDILKEVHRQLENSSKSKGVNEEDINVLLMNPPKEVLSNEDNEQLEGEITPEEVVAAIRSFEKHKTPGRDGIPIELYKMFEAELSEILSLVYNSCYEEEELSVSMYEGVIKQVFKEKGDREDISNWRPLTMLNVDYKILAKVLLNRMKFVASKVVSLDQTCSVQGRDIRDGVFAILNAIEDANIDGVEAAIVSVDHKAAFDVIEWPFLFRALEHFGFSNKFIKWIRTIYKPGCLFSSVIVNGWISDSFEVTRGIRQGCPLSALLYVIASEIACNAIRANEKVIGITVAGNETKLSNYADDTNFLLTGYESIEHVMRTYDVLHRASGATLNTAKTKILLLNVLSISDPPEEYKSFVVDELKIYGHTFDKNGLALKSCFAEVEKAITKLELIIPHHEFSLESRAQFVGTYFLSKFWFVCSFANPPPELMKRTEQAINRFLWYPSRQNKIRKEVIKNCKENGGVGLQDISFKIKAMRLMLFLRFLKSPDAFCWSDAFDEHLANLRRWPKTMWPQLKCSQIYKDILEIESESGLKVLESGYVQIYGKLLKLKDVTTKVIYNLMKEKSLQKEIRKQNEKWCKIFGKDEFNVTSFFCNNFPKHVDGYTKDVHYCITHNALFTNSRLAKFKAFDENCSFCASTGQMVKESNFHAIVECHRVQGFWAQFETLLRELDDQLVFKTENKIFGFENKMKTPERGPSNLLLHLAQRSIWLTRNVFENKKLACNVFSHFGKSLLSTAKRAKRLMGKEQHELVFAKVLQLIELPTLQLL